MLAMLVLRYKKVLDDHNVNAFVGSNLEYKEIRYLNAEKRELEICKNRKFLLAVGDQFIYGSHYDWAIAGFFAHIIMLIATVICRVKWSL